jgi:hypothetical protein
MSFPINQSAVPGPRASNALSIVLPPRRAAIERGSLFSVVIAAILAAAPLAARRLGFNLFVQRQVGIGPA